MKQHARGIFFDVDDTLYDHLAPFRKAVSLIGGTPDDFPYEEAYHRFRYYSDILSLEMGGAGSMEAGATLELMRTKRFRLALGEFGLAPDEEQARAMQEAYNACQYDIEMFPGARELIAELARRGDIVGLITNGAGSHQAKKIEAMRLDEWIPPARRFVSGEVGWDKPDKRLFEYVNRQTGTRPDNCIYIGDSWRNDVVGALEAGWTVIWFNHRGVKPETEHRPQHTAAAYADLRRLLLDRSEAK